MRYSVSQPAVVDADRTSVFYPYPTTVCYPLPPSEVPAWSKAARMVFSMSCTSAASERVFSLVEEMFGRDQESSLADSVQAGVMLRYNGRALG